LAVRWPDKKKGGWHYSVLVFNLTNKLIFELARSPIPNTYSDLILLAQLAYNMTGWVQSELAQHSSTIASFGTLRMIRDAFQIAGKIEFDPDGNIVSVTSNHIHKLAKVFYDYWQAHFQHSQVSFILGKI
jgi:hypothetical protein